MPLALPLPDLVSLDLLCSVAEFGSIRRAAQAHNISQPAASMRLKSLEKTLGVTLLERSAGHSHLSPAGIAVVQWSSEIVSKLDDLLIGVRALRTESHSNLTFAASMTVAEYLVPLWLSRLRQAKPEVIASLRTGNSESVIEMIRSEKAEIGFVEGWAVPAHFDHSIVCDDDLVVVVDPSHPWAHRKKLVTAKELSSTPLILREIGSGTREVLDRSLENLGYSPTVLSEMASNTAIKSMVSSGMGPGILSKLATQSEIDSGGLVVVRIVGISLKRVIRAIWWHDRKLSSASKMLLDIAKSYNLNLHS